MENKTYDYGELIPLWENIGLRNVWIAGAYDPPFNRNRLNHCPTMESLKAKLTFDSWALGESFYFKNLCFINQRDAGDEWLAIRGSLAFESITFRNIIRRDAFERYIGALLTATDDELLRLTYWR